MKIYQIIKGEILKLTEFLVFFSIYVLMSINNKHLQIKTKHVLKMATLIIKLTVTPI